MSRLSFSNYLLVCFQIDRAARRDAAAAKHGVEHRVMLTRADARTSHDAAAQSQEPSFGIDGDASGRIHL